VHRIDGGIATALLAGLLTVSATGCGGSGSSTPDTSLSPVSPASALPQRGGLVGAIDSARLVTVCGDVQALATEVEGGLPTASVDEAFGAVLSALRQTPHDPALAALATRWERLRAKSGDTVTARRLQAFCARQ
jgi:hypothetical protein